MTTAAWIKMRTNLWDDPRVSSICDSTGALEATVVGALYWLWATADEHSVDGVLPGLSLASIDRKTRVKGLAAALVGVGWIEDTTEGVRLPRFDEHNGASAKRRSLDAKTKAKGRHGVDEMSASDADEKPTPSGRDAVLEQEREKEKSVSTKPTAPSHPPAVAVGEGFGEFWLVWPRSERKQDKAKCLDHWKRNHLAEVAARIVADVKAKRGSRKWADGFDEAPLTYLRGRRWEDEAQAPEGGDLAEWWETRAGAKRKAEETGYRVWDETTPFRDYIAGLRTHVGGRPAVKAVA